MNIKRNFLICIIIFLILSIFSGISYYNFLVEQKEKNINIYNQLIEIDQGNKDIYENPINDKIVNEDANEMYLNIFSKITIIGLMPHFIHLFVLFFSMLYFYKLFSSEKFYNLISKEKYKYIISKIKKGYIFSLIVPIFSILIYIISFIITKNINIYYFDNDNTIVSYIITLLVSIINLVILGIVFTNVGLLFSIKKRNFNLSFLFASFTIIIFYIIAEVLSINSDGFNLSSFHPASYFTRELSCSIYTRSITVSILFLVTILLIIYKFKKYFIGIKKED